MRRYLGLEESELGLVGPLGQARDFLQADVLAEGVAGLLLQLDVALKQIGVVPSTVDQVATRAEDAERARQARVAEDVGYVGRLTIEGLVVLTSGVE